MDYFLPYEKLAFSEPCRVCPSPASVPGRGAELVGALGAGEWQRVKCTVRGPWMQCRRLKLSEFELV